MQATTDAIKQEFARLSTDEQISLVQDLWDIVAEKPDEIPVTAAQREELERRQQMYEQNPQEGATWPEVLNKIQSQTKAGR